MASLASSCRLTARAASRQVVAQSRAYRATPSCLAAHNFTMPALSPTMTEGNIASWKVKEGDEFVAGDVLLEVETDKAQMDVEAQDDGVVAKIMTEGGAKGVKVGTRIAVLADPGDDIKSLEIPEEDSKPAEEPAKEEKTESKASESSSQESSPSEPAPKKSSPPKPKGQGTPQKYPLYPSVAVLLHQHHIAAEDVTATGPNGRLLKGDVLAHLDQISSSYPAELASRVGKLSHLDLSNIKPAAPKEPPKKAAAAQEEMMPELPVELMLPVSLSAVLEVQKRMQDSLGITLPLSTFLARAIALANEDLPYKSAKPTADELFNSVLGLPSFPQTRDGKFRPEIIGLPDPSIRAAMPRRAKKADLFDDLVASKKRSVPIRSIPAASGAIGAENVFSLSVEKGEEKRAQIFLERVKTVLEAEPGRLVL